MVATESQDVLNRRFVSDFASVWDFFNTLLGRVQSGDQPHDRPHGPSSWPGREQARLPHAGAMSLVIRP